MSDREGERGRMKDVHMCPYVSDRETEEGGGGWEERIKDVHALSLSVRQGQMCLTETKRGEGEE